jgi:hypothetical protein
MLLLALDAVVRTGEIELAPEPSGVASRTGLHLPPDFLFLIDLLRKSSLRRSGPRNFRGWKGDARIFSTGADHH